MTWKTIFNPFEKYDEKNLLITGILFFILNIFGCYYAGNVNDSIFHLSHLKENQTIWDRLDELQGQSEADKDEIIRLKEENKKLKEKVNGR